VQPCYGDQGCVLEVDDVQPQLRFVGVYPVLEKLHITPLVAQDAEVTHIGEALEFAVRTG
jgi:hypothetical protein